MELTEQLRAENERLLEEVKGLRRTLWLVMRATAGEGPVSVGRSILEDFDPVKARIDTWTYADGSYGFQATYGR